MKVAICVEQYNMVGILPSQLESIALLNTAMGITDAAYIDLTPDGFDGVGGFTRYASWVDFFAAETGPFIAFSPDMGEDVRTLDPVDAWLLFGPSMGWGDLLNDIDVTWSHIPGGVMNSRDAVPIAIWETSKWRGQ